ncbi:MAG TPA: heparinase II/III family protein [bacterium]|nr:heparinase II/III family protein [bacterium]HPN42129.1 heparinase II/III family protein [bacterium]
MSDISWHKDYISDFEYPHKRFDKISISDWFDQGIDVKFPWEVSRFYFAIPLAQNYLTTHDKIFYLKFKKLVLDWIDKNPFLYGVNWLCTMEVAIRAINWIVAVNLFKELFSRDKQFQQILSKSLVQHTEYIAHFPERGQNGFTNNHTTADYTGLLFLALTLKAHPKSGKWLQQAQNGLIECMDKQVYGDGVNFENSIPYHRLVAELFGFSAVLCLANDIKLPAKYYSSLFKMFEFTAAYIDSNGNAPQVGDNDSGRVLIFHNANEQDHSCLLDLGEHIFDYHFLSQCNKRNTHFISCLPSITWIKPESIQVMPRPTDTSMQFTEGGYIILKARPFQVFFCSFPNGRYGKTGHSHLDIGSVCMSILGQPVLVDPGTLTYTRSKKDRDQFRAFNYHNVSITKEYQNFSSNGFFALKIDNNSQLYHFSNHEINFGYNYFNSNIKRRITIENDAMNIIDRCDHEFITLFHLHPDIKIIKSSENDIVVDLNLSKMILILHSMNAMAIEKYLYSPAYGAAIPGSKIIISGQSEIALEFKVMVNKDKGV